MMDENEGRLPIRRRSSKRASGGILKTAERKPLSQVLELTALDQDDPTYAKRPKRNRKRVSFQSTKSVMTFCKDADENDQNMLNATNGQEEKVNISQLSDDGTMHDVTLNDNDQTINIQKYFARNFCQEDSAEVTLNMTAPNFIANPPSPSADIGNKTMQLFDDISSETDSVTFNFPKSPDGESPETSTNEDDDLKVKECQQDIMALFTKTGENTNEPLKENPTNMEFILHDREDDRETEMNDDPIFSGVNVISFIKKAPSVSDDNAQIKNTTMQVDLNDLTTISEVSMNMTDVTEHTEMIMKQLENSMVSANTSTKVLSDEPEDVNDTSIEEGVTPIEAPEVNTIKVDTNLTKSSTVLSMSANALPEHHINLSTILSMNQPKTEQRKDSFCSTLSMQNPEPKQHINVFSSTLSSHQPKTDDTQLKQAIHVFGSASNTSLPVPQSTTENTILKAASTILGSVSTTLPGASISNVPPIDSNFRDRNVDTSGCEMTPNQSMFGTPQQADKSPGEVCTATGDTPSFIETFNNKINLAIGLKETEDHILPPIENMLPLIHSVTPNQAVQVKAGLTTPLVNTTRIPEFDPSKTFATEGPRKSAFTPVRYNKTLPIRCMVSNPSSQEVFSCDSPISKTKESESQLVCKNLANSITDTVQAPSTEMPPKTIDTSKIDGLKEMSSFLERFTTKSSVLPKGDVSTIKTASFIESKLENQDHLNVEINTIPKDNETFQLSAKIPSPTKEVVETEKITEKEHPESPSFPLPISNVVEREKKEKNDRRMTFTLDDVQKKTTHGLPPLPTNLTEKETKVKNDRRMTYTLEEINTIKKVVPEALQTNSKDSNKAKTDRRKTYTIEDVQKQELPVAQPERENKKGKNDRRRTYTVNPNTIIAENGKLGNDGKWLDEYSIDETMYFKIPIANSSAMVPRGDYGLLTDDDTTAPISKLEGDSNKTELSVKPIDRPSTENIVELVGKAISDAEKSLLKQLEESPCFGDVEQKEKEKLDEINNLETTMDCIQDGATYVNLDKDDARNVPSHEDEKLSQDQSFDVSVQESQGERTIIISSPQIKSKTPTRSSTLKQTFSDTPSQIKSKTPTRKSTRSLAKEPLSRTPPQVKSKTPTRNSTVKQTSCNTPSRIKNKTPARKSTIKKTPLEQPRRTPSRKAKADRTLSPPLNAFESRTAKQDINNIPCLEEDFPSDPFASRPKIPRDEGGESVLAEQNIQETRLEDKKKAPVNPSLTESHSMTTEKISLSSSNTIKTKKTDSPGIEDDNTPSPFKRSSKVANSPKDFIRMDFIDELPLVAQEDDTNTTKDKTITKKRKRRKRLNMSTNSKRKVDSDIKKIQDEINNNSNGLYWVDEITDDIIITSFKVYRHHKLHIQFEGTNITKIRVCCQFDEWLPTGETWYLSTMERIFDENRLNKKYTKMSQITQLLSEAENKLSSWHPLIYDIFRTFKQNLGHVELSSDRMTYQFLVKKKQLSYFLFHVDFDTSQESVEVKYSLEHQAFSFLLKDVQQFLNWKEVMSAIDKPPVLETCSRIKKFCEDIEIG